MGVGIAAQDQAAALGQDIGGRGGWHAAFPSVRRISFNERCLNKRRTN
jgi:hypothetical protein